MPAFVKRRPGDCGSREAEGTMVCCFDLKKSKKDWRISLDVILGKFYFLNSNEGSQRRALIVMKVVVEVVSRVEGRCEVFMDG